MKNKLLLPLLKLLSYSFCVICFSLWPSSHLHAQSVFTKIYDDIDLSQGYSVKQTSDSGFIICGTTLPGGNWTGFLIKTNNVGDTLWTKTYGDSVAMQFHDVGVTSTNEYITTGTLKINLVEHIELRKADANGDTLWTTQLGAPGISIGYDLIQMTDGSIAIASYSTGQLGIAKTDANGMVLWEKSYGGSGTEYGMAMDTTSDGGFILGGYTDSYGAGGDDFWLVKTDGAGDTLWTRTYGGVDYDVANTVKQTPDGGYVIAGGTWVPGDFNAYIIKTDSAGTLLWSINLGTSEWDYISSCQVTPEGDYVFTGNTGNDVLLLKTDAAGNLLWQKSYGDSIYYNGSHIELTSDGGYAIAGFTRDSSIFDDDVLLIKTDSLATGFANRLFQISTAVTESIPQADHTLTFSPNPFSTSTLLTTGNPEPVTSVSIYDISARLVYEERGLFGSTIRLRRNNLLSGIYFVVVRFRNGETNNGKVVIERQ